MGHMSTQSREVGKRRRGPGPRRSRYARPAAAPAHDSGDGGSAFYILVWLPFSGTTIMAHPTVVRLVFGRRAGPESRVPVAVMSTVSNRIRKL
jgi:hypothetical protein